VKGRSSKARDRQDDSSSSLRSTGEKDIPWEQSQKSINLPEDEGKGGGKRGEKGQNEGQSVGREG